MRKVVIFAMMMLLLLILFDYGLHRRIQMVFWQGSTYASRLVFLKKKKLL